MISILVLRGGAIGDFVLTLPVLAALRRQFPQGRLVLLGSPRIAQLAGNLVDDVRSVESPSLAGFFTPRGNLDPAWAEFFAGFSIIISYLHDPTKVFETNMARFSAARFIAGPHRPDESLAVHATDTFLAPLRHLGISNSDPVPHLPIADPSDDDTAVNGPAASVPRGAGIGPARYALLALHPGSGSPRKNWPESRWAALLEGLVADTNVGFLLVGGEAEGDTYRRLSGLIPAPRAVPAFNLPLAQLARVLSHCIGFIGHDSGISHLAAAVGLPGLILWGPTSAAVWCPRSPHMTILCDPAGLDHLKVARVRSALASRFPKWIP